MEWNGRIYKMKRKEKMFAVWVFSRGVASIYKHNAYLVAFGSITHQSLKLLTADTRLLGSSLAVLCLPLSFSLWINILLQNISSCIILSYFSIITFIFLCLSNIVTAKLSKRKKIDRIHVSFNDQRLGLFAVFAEMDNLGGNYVNTLSCFLKL